MYIPDLIHKYIYERLDLTIEEKAMFNSVCYLKPDSLRDLAAKTGVGYYKARTMCRSLASRGWVRLAKYGRKYKPIPWIPERYQQMLSKSLEDDYALAMFGGEFLFGRILEFVVDVPRFIKNARPDFLKHPKTGQSLELDFYAPGILGGEFNGRQHYASSEKYMEKEVIEIMERDLIKEALCARKRLPLVVANNQALNIQTVASLIPPNIPKHIYDLKDPYPQKLNGLCALYVKKAERMVRRERQKANVVGIS